MICIFCVKCLTGVYLELVDAEGHDYGPESDEVRDAMKQVDDELIRLLDVLKEIDNVNVMVFSDHGMAERVGGPADTTSGFINVLDYVNSTDCQHIAGSTNAGPVVQIWPKPDKEDFVSLLAFISCLSLDSGDTIRRVLPL